MKVMVREEEKLHPTLPLFCLRTIEEGVAGAAFVGVCFGSGRVAFLSPGNRGTSIGLCLCRCLLILDDIAEREYYEQGKSAPEQR